MAIRQINVQHDLMYAIFTFHKQSSWAFERTYGETSFRAMTRTAKLVRNVWYKPHFSRPL